MLCVEVNMYVRLWSDPLTEVTAETSDGLSGWDKTLYHQKDFEAILCCRFNQCID